MSRHSVTATRPTSNRARNARRAANDDRRRYYGRREVAELAAEYEAAGFGRRTAGVMAR